jgi:hypothetical protein
LTAGGPSLRNPLQSLAGDPARLLLLELIAPGRPPETCHHEEAMPAHHPGHDDDELPTLETAELAKVTGGAGMDMSSMLPIMMMMRGKAQPAAAAVTAPAAAPAWQPKVTVDGVDQALTATGNGGFTATADV